FRNLDNYRIISAQSVPSSNCLVSSLKCFHSQDSSVADNNGLADVQPAHFFRYFESENDIFNASFLRFWARNQSLGSDGILEVSRCRKQHHTNFVQLACHRSEERFRVPSR